MCRRLVTEDRDADQHQPTSYAALCQLRMYPSQILTRTNTCNQGRRTDHGHAIWNGLEFHESHKLPRELQRNGLLLREPKVPSKYRIVCEVGCDNGCTGSVEGCARDGSSELSEVKFRPLNSGFNGPRFFPTIAHHSEVCSSGLTNLNVRPTRVLYERLGLGLWASTIIGRVGGTEHPLVPNCVAFGPTRR